MFFNSRGHGHCGLSSIWTGVALLVSFDAVAETPESSPAPVEAPPVAVPPVEAPPVEAPPPADAPPPVEPELPLPPPDETPPPPDETPPPPETPTPPPAQTFPGLMNPAISVNGLFLAGIESDDGAIVKEPSELAGRGEGFGTGLAVQELEIQFQAAVDPYFKANLVVAIPGDEPFEVEEGYLTLTSLPRVLVNIGKIKEPFGRENLAHTHALLTIDKSLIGQRVFGEEGLNDIGLNAQILLPTPWFSELTIGGDAGNNEVVLGSGDPEGLSGMVHWKNLFDLGETATLEAGISGLIGKNAFDGRSIVAGADVTIKGGGRGRRQWNRYVWQNEFLIMDRQGADEDARLGGLYSTFEYALSRRWWIGGRYDYVGVFSDDTAMAGTLIGVFAPTEFSAVRIQAQRQFLPDGHTADSIVGQLNFTLGAHPAHSY